MKDMRKTKKELIRELEGLRRTKGRQNPKIISDKLNSPEEQLQNVIYKSFYDYSPLMCYTVDRAVRAEERPTTGSWK
jgi:hypothetical protein